MDTINGLESPFSILLHIIEEALFCSKSEMFLNVMVLHCVNHYAQYVPLTPTPHTHPLTTTHSHPPITPTPSCIHTPTCTHTHPDDLPIRGFIGHLEEGTFLPHNHKTYLWTHLHFAFEYNGNQVRNEERRDRTVL